VDAQREGDVGTLAAAGPGAVEGASEGLEADLDVSEAARVKERLAGTPPERQYSAMPSCSAWQNSP